MPCFCTVPADIARNRFNIGITPLLPPPLSLKLAAALPAIDPDSRLDMQIAAGFSLETLPVIDFGGGPLAQIAMMLSLMVGTFELANLPQLDMQMQQAATSITSNIWPRLGWLTTLKLPPLLNFAIIARLVLDLRDLGMDPFAVTAAPPTPALPPSFRLALTPPQIRMAKLLAGLPPLMKLSAALAIPPLGETGAVSALQNRLSGLASLTPPSLIIPMPLLTRLAMVLESLATIQAAFGEDAFSPTTLSRINLMLALWGKFQIPIPLPALALKAKLDLLPTLDDIRLGERIAGSSSGFLMTPFSPPKLVIAPFLNVVLALHASMQVALNMEPFDMCSLCPCS